MSLSFIKSQGSTIIQEGVETKEQLDIVTKCGSDYIQDFYFSDALSGEEFIEYLKKKTANSIIN